MEGHPMPRQIHLARCFFPQRNFCLGVTEGVALSHDHQTNFYDTKQNKYTSIIFGGTIPVV
jgi:hypothetical protein